MDSPIKNAYNEWINDTPLEWFLSVEVNKKFVNTHRSGLNQHFNRLFKCVNRSIFGRSYRKNGQYLKGFVVMERKDGFPHWHLLIQPIKDRNIDLYCYIEKALTKVKYKGERVFRKTGRDKKEKGVGVYLEPIDQSRKANVVGYILKEFFNSDHVILLGSEGVTDMDG